MGEALDELETPTGLGEVRELDSVGPPTFLTEVKQLENYRNIISTMRDRALGPTESCDFISGLLKGL